MTDFTIPQKQNPKIIEFTGKRIQYHSALDFDEVLDNLEARIGATVDVKELTKIPDTLEGFEDKIKLTLGESGFVSMNQMDYTELVGQYGIKRRVMRWIFGNPLIAITMLSKDLTAGLFVPVDILLTENANNEGCTVTYLQPSSIIVISNNEPLLQAAQVLDQKMEDLISISV